MIEQHKQKIDAKACEWRTGVEYAGNYECMLNKCCDYKCDWYKRRKFEQALIRIRQLLSDALDSDVTNADESINNMYEALELCDVLDG